MGRSEQWFLFLGLGSFDSFWCCSVDGFFRYKERIEKRKYRILLSPSISAVIDGIWSLSYSFWAHSSPSTLARIHRLAFGTTATHGMLLQAFGSIRTPSPTGLSCLKISLTLCCTYKDTNLGKVHGLCWAFDPPEASTFDELEKIRIFLFITLLDIFILRREWFRQLIISHDEIHVTMLVLKFYCGPMGFNRKLTNGAPIGLFFGMLSGCRFWHQRTSWRSKE